MAKQHKLFKGLNVCSTYKIAVVTMYKQGSEKVPPGYLEKCCCCRTLL